MSHCWPSAAEPRDRCRIRRRWRFLRRLHSPGRRRVHFRGLSLLRLLPEGPHYYRGTNESALSKGVRASRAWGWGAKSLQRWKLHHGPKIQAILHEICQSKPQAWSFHTGAGSTNVNTTNDECGGVVIGTKKLALLLSASGAQITRTNADA